MGAPVILATTELVPHPDTRDTLLEALRFVQDHARMKPGCLGCQIFEAVDGARAIQYAESWDSVEGLHAHIQSSLYLRLLHAMELAVEKPRISFHTITETQSMELIEELRIRQGSRISSKP